jgi:hypothetical protein
MQFYLSFNMLEILRVIIVFTTWQVGCLLRESLAQPWGHSSRIHPYIMYLKPINTDIYFRRHILSNMVSESSIFLLPFHLSPNPNPNPRVCRRPGLTWYQSSLLHKGSRRPTRKTMLTTIRRCRLQPRCHPSMTPVCSGCRHTKNLIDGHDHSGAPLTPLQAVV